MQNERTSSRPLAAATLKPAPAGLARSFEQGKESRRAQSGRREDHAATQRRHGQCEEKNQSQGAAEAGIAGARGAPRRRHPDPGRERGSGRARSRHPGRLRRPPNRPLPGPAGVCGAAGGMPEHRDDGPRHAPGHCRRHGDARQRRRDGGAALVAAEVAAAAPGSADGSELATPWALTPVAAEDGGRAGRRWRGKRRS